MFKNFLLISLASITLTFTSGCSLFSSDSEGEEQVSEETASDDSSSEEASTDESSSDSSSSEEVASSDNDEEEVVDEYPDDDYGGEESVVAGSTEESIPDQPVEGNQEQSLFVSGDENTSSTDTAMADSGTVQDSLGDTSGATKSFIPVRKMKKTPYNEGGALINRLYIARDGDTVQSVAQKVYGDGSRSKDILAWNPHFRGKGLNVGDKVYYSSAQNPQDSSAILLYYEEAGIQPSFYTAKNGESIRKVSQNLLGHPRSWMEVWATNDIESKWDMPAGAQLRYWPSGTVGAPVQAQTPTESLPSEPMPGDEGGAAAIADASGADQMAGEEPPPGDDMGAAGQIADSQEPPPPPPEPVAPPPPPPPEPMAAPAPIADNGGLANMMGSENDSMMMAVLGGLLILAALILLVFIRRGRKKVNYG